MRLKLRTIESAPAVSQPVKAMAIKAATAKPLDVTKVHKPLEDLIAEIEQLEALKKSRSRARRTNPKELQGEADNWDWLKLLTAKFGSSHKVDYFEEAKFRVDLTHDTIGYRIAVIRCLGPECFFVTLCFPQNAIKTIDFDYVEKRNLIKAVNCAISAFNIMNSVTSEDIGNE